MRSTQVGSALRVGWFIDTPTAGVIYDAPRPLNHTYDRGVTDRKSPDHCPAVQALHRDIYVICAPYSMVLRCVASGPGFELRLDRARSDVSSEAARQVTRLMPRREWRKPNRPLLQLLAPYVFVTDDALELEQTAPHLHYMGGRRPGIVLGGRFPFRDWPRPLSFAFEWYDLDKPLILERGEPWFYVSFHPPMDDRVHLQRIVKSRPIEMYQAHISGVAGFTARTFDLIEKARLVRPETLLSSEDAHDG